jgi:sugar phosphate isomerase/epimerase
VKLSLSVRVAESSTRKDRAEMPLEELAPLARAAGFRALSMRASAVSVDTKPDRLRDIRALLDREGLGVSMVTGNVALAANTPAASDALRDIGPHLDLAEALGAKLVRVMIRTADDIPHAQRAADQAAERGLSIAQQTHWGTLCETVDQALDLVSAVDRPGFGITFEPANLLGCGGEYGPDAIARLAPHLANVYFQNVRLNPDGAHCFPTRAKGDVRLDYVALDDPSGMDAAEMVAALKASGYDGWVTVHQPLRSGETVADAVEEAARVFGALV